MINDPIHDDPKTSHAKFFRDSFALHKDFISEIEESNLVIEVDPHLQRQVYEKDHWDDVSNKNTYLILQKRDCLMI